MGTEQQQPGDDLDEAKGTVRFRRKPAKTGTNYLISIPRALVRSGAVDPDVEYEVYLRKVVKGRP